MFEPLKKEIGVLLLLSLTRQDRIPASSVHRVLRRTALSMFQWLSIRAVHSVLSLAAPVAVKVAVSLLSKMKLIASETLEYQQLISKDRTALL